MEVLRQRSVTPLNARTAMEDTILNGCHIPKVRRRSYFYENIVEVEKFILNSFLR